jgi:hypothetical protein
MSYHHDADEFETVFESRPCTSCQGDPSKCNGRCNGMGAISTRRRPANEVIAIKAERLRKEEDEILLKAEAIKRARGIAP